MRLLVALIVLGLAAPAARGDEENLEEAKAHFKAASAYFTQGDYEKALEEFKASARYSSRPGLLFNIGRCYERIGDAAHAVDYYRRYLAALPDAEDRGEVEASLALLERRVGRLEIRSTVPGARLTLDGAPLDGGADRLTLTVGMHVVTAAREGYLTRSVSVQVRPGEVAAAVVDPVLPLAGASEPARARPGRSSRWKLWLGLGLGAAAVVAAAVTVGVVVSSSGGRNFWSQASSSCQAPCQLADFR